MLIQVAVVVIGLLASMATSVPLDSQGKSTKYELVARQVSDQCSEFDSTVRNLAAFEEFYELYTKLNDCVHPAGLTKTPMQICLEAEKTCEQNGLLYSSVKPMSGLVGAFKTGYPICTLEFSMKVYHLHHQYRQLQFGVTEKGLARVLRILANKATARCRQSLDDRLEIVEKRAPDTVKYTTLIYGLMNGGLDDTIAKTVPISVQDFVPVLEREQVIDESLGRNPSGFEFKMTTPIRLALDSARMSCNAMKLYHVNLIGSLGLLASLGYGAKQEATQISSRARRWVMSSIVCQTLRTVLKMNKESVEGKVVGRVKVLPIQEAEVALADETDDQFASFRLPESQNPIDLAEESVEDLKRFDPIRINMRKIHLLNGPNYGMAKTIYALIDLTQPNRRSLPYDILSLTAPAELDDSNDDEEEEDE